MSVRIIDASRHCSMRSMASYSPRIVAFALLATSAQLNLHQIRELRTDQYGIRTLIEIDGQAIKFGIIHEGRITLEPAGPKDQVCGVATLTALDMVTTKLFANADRWADRVVYSRDIIDLAMIAPSGRLMQQAIAKASVPYGDSVRESLNKSIDYLRENPHRLDECQQALKMRGDSEGRAVATDQEAARRLSGSRPAWSWVTADLAAVCVRHQCDCASGPQHNGHRARCGVAVGEVAARQASDLHARPSVSQARHPVCNCNR